MPVQKFRNLDEMRRALWREGMGAPVRVFLKRAAELWARTAKISPRQYPRGVFKFHNLEEAQAARERITEENIERLRRERSR
jgi:hypothetical protein